MPVRPGVTDTIEFPIQSDSTSGIDSTGVQLAVQVTPSNMASDFQVNSITIKEDPNATLPITVPVGQTRTFVINYTISQNAQSGDTFQVNLNANFPDQVILPDPGTWATSVNFVIDQIKPQVRVTSDESFEIPDQSVTTTQNVQVQGTDLKPDGSAGSGVKKISLIQTTGGNYSEDESFDSPQTTEQVMFPTSFDILGSGSYRAEVTDQAGNVSTSAFSIPPRVTLDLQEDNSTTEEEIATGNAGLIDTFAPKAGFKFEANDIGIASIQITPNNGEASVNLSYDPPNTATPGFTLNLKDGDYAFTVTAGNGLRTSGVLRAYTFNAVVDTSQEAAKIIGGQFVFTPNIKIVDTSRSFKSAALYDSVNDQNGAIIAMATPRLSLSCSTNDQLNWTCPIPQDANITPGNYVIEATDDHGTISTALQLQSVQGSVNDFLAEATLNNTMRATSETSANGVSLSTVPIPNDKFQYAASGTLVTGVHSFLGGSGGLANSPPGAIGAALSGPPGYSPGFDVPFDLVRLALPAQTDEVAGDTGMTVTWEVATGMTAETIGAYVPVSKVTTRVQGDPNLLGEDLVKTDTPLTSFPMNLDVYARWRVTLTANSSVIWPNAPYAVSPLVSAVSYTPQIAMANVFQAAGVMFERKSSDNLCSVTAPAPDLTVAQAAQAGGPPGQQPVSSGYAVDPTLIFPTPATIRIQFSTQAVADAGLDLNNVAMYVQPPHESLARVPSQMVDSVSGQVTGYVSSLALDSIFELYAPPLPPPPPPPPPPGTNPPSDVSIVAVSSQSVELAWSPNGNPQGTAYTVAYGTVTDAASCGSNPPEIYIQVTTTTFLASALQPGAAYQFDVCTVGSGSSLCSGTLQVATVPAGQGSTSGFTVYTCGGGSSGGGGGGTSMTRGLAIAADAGGKLWEIADDSGAISLARYGPSGLELSSPLDGADDHDGQWSIRFDKGGGVYAIGMAAGAGGARDPAVFRLVQADGALLSSATFHAGDGVKTGVWDSNGDFWITGLVQGTKDAPDTSLGLWKYSSATGQVTQTASFGSAAAPAAGFGVRAMDGAIYVVGYTSTQPVTTPALAVSLWKFDAQGHGPIAGPFTEPDGLLTSLGADAKLEASSGTLYAAGERTDAAGFNDVDFIRFDANGGILSDHYIAAPSGVNLTPAAMATDAQGDILVAVSAGSGDGAGHGVATFARDGGLIGVAATQHGKGAVYGMAQLGGQLWLAVDGSTAPVLFVGDQPIPVQDVLVSSGPVDAGPPATELQVAGSSVTSGQGFARDAAFALSSADPPDPAGLASGVAETLYWVDLDPFACDADYDETQPAGTCANPVYAAPFTLSVGSHTVSFQSTDAAGNFEDLKTVTVFVGYPQYAAAIQRQQALAAPAGGVAVTELGNFLYISEPSLGRVLRMGLDGRVQAAFSGFGAAGPGPIAAAINEGVSVADTGNSRVVHLDAGGALLGVVSGPFQAIVGLEEDPYSGDDGVVDEEAGGVFFARRNGRVAGPVYVGSLSQPRGAFIDRDEDQLIVDSGHAQVFVAGADGTYSTFGSGLSDPDQIAVADDGRVFVSDRADHAIHVFDASRASLGVIGGLGYGALDFASVAGLAVDPAGRLYVADGSRLLVLALGSSSSGAPVIGALTLDAVSPWAGNFSLSAPSPQAALYDLRYAQAPIVTDADFAAAMQMPVGGVPSEPGVTDALRVSGLSPGGTYYVAVKAYDSVGRVSNMATGSFVTGRAVTKGALVTVAGHEDFQWLGDGWPATLGSFFKPRGLASDAAGDLYVTDGLNNNDERAPRVRRIDAATRVMTTIAGGRYGFSGDGGPATEAAFSNVRGIAVDSRGDVYVGDPENNRIRRIDPAGIVTTVAGNGVPGFSGDGGPASAAQIASPRYMVVDAQDDLIFADSGNSRVRRIDGRTGIITTLAGNGQAASTGDGGPATLASLNFDIDVALAMDASGDLYITEINGNRIRKVDGKTGIITTVAGDGTDASTGDGGPASAAQVAGPGGIAVDPVGDVYFTEGDSSRIRRIDARSGVITTVAGDGVRGAYGEDGPASQAELSLPASLLLDAPSGLLYVAEQGNSRIAALGLDPFLSAQSAAVVGGQPEAAAVSTAPFTVTQVSTATQAGALLLSTAAAGGLSPVGDVFVISPAAAPGAPLELSFTFDPAGVDTAAVSIYHFDGVAWSSTVIVNQAITVLDNGFYRITGQAILTSPFAVFQFHPDTVPPVTTLSFSGPAFSSGTVVFGSSTTAVVLAAVDVASGTLPASGVAQTDVSVDGAPLAPYAGPFALGEGAHQISYRSVDHAGNVEPARAAAFDVDAAPPASALSIGQPQYALPGALLVGSSTPFSLSAIDPVSSGVASGVKDAWYAVGGAAASTAAFQAYGSPFTLGGADGARTVSYYARDNVLNAEVARSTTVLLDAAPPTVVLRSPGACAGVCRVVKGKVEILGDAADAHLAGYALDFAPGQGATTGYALISSAAAAGVSGTLGVWDASGLSGWQTLRLSASDLVRNVAIATAAVFVGDPAESLVLGSHDLFSMPQGVAAGPDGTIYVADTGRDRVEVFSSTGGALASFGQPWADDAVPASTVTLRGPRGVAVDAAGNVFVADTGRHRVLELSPAGQVLLQLGKRHALKDGKLLFSPGSALGEFNAPSGVAVDGSGRIYVADTLNHRVQVFTSTGGVALAFSLPAAGPPSAAGKGEDDDHDDGTGLGKPFGVAADASGKIYVADPRGSRALVYDAAGRLLLTLPLSGATHWAKPNKAQAKAGTRVVAGRPEGVAVSPDGECLLVSDRRLSRVVRFDGLGEQLLAFGVRGRLRDDAPPPASIVFDKPVGLALAADGTLLVADRNNDRVERLGVPTGAPRAVVPPPRAPLGDVARDVVDKDEGGGVSRPDNAGVELPPGALAKDLQVTVSTMSPASAAQADAMLRTADEKGIKPAYAPVEYGPEGTQFTTPVTLTLPYDPAITSAQDIAENALQINYWNPAKKEWETLSSTVDTSRHVVTAQTSHFSLYQVMSGTASAQGLAAQATATNDVAQLQVACNPLRPACRPMAFQGLPARARLRLYTLAGNLVKDFSSDSQGTATWDGSNQDGQPAASGVYFLFAQGAGTTKTFKVAVQR